MKKTFKFNYRFEAEMFEAFANDCCVFTETEVEEYTDKHGITNGRFIVTLEDDDQETLDNIEKLHNSFKDGKRTVSEVFGEMEEYIDSFLEYKKDQEINYEPTGKDRIIG